MGRKSVRRTIVVAMQGMVNSSDLLRQEQNDFDIVACPSYIELLDEMVVLNTDRKNTAFILVDPPFRLAPSASSLKAWMTNSNLAPTNSEQGLATLNEYAAVYYPNAFASELTGLDVAVPASHVMLRTIALNDQVAYPWFAPAGLRRGVVNNATSVGYIKDGEFVPVPLGQGVRDIMYENRLNPIVIQPTGGVVVFGQKTLNITSSAMDRVNVARLVVYIRRQLDRLVKPYLFEPNDQQTRNEVKKQVESFFSELVSLRGLYDFLVVCDDSNNTPERIDRNELYVDIAIKPVKAIEFIYIPIRIKNTGESLA
jgi:phage tail sheath protein FI